MPTAAVFSLMGASIEIAFDVPIVDKDAIDIENWWARINDKLQVITAAAAIPAGVMLVVTAGAADAGPDVVSFDPPPFDVETDAGGRAAPFENFPVSVEAKARPVGQV